MNKNSFHVISSILKGVWFIDPDFVKSHSHFITSLITKGEINDDVFGEPTKVKAINSATLEMTEISTVSEIQESSVAVIPLIGPIMKYDSWCEYGTQSRKEQLQAAIDNPKIDGVIFYIDSPGGESLAMELLHDAIIEAKQSKPVYAVVEGLCCSAAMGIASACTKIYLAGESCIVGSIGTMCSFVDVRGWKEYEGVKFHEVYATKSTDKNKDYRDALEGNYETMRNETLDPLNEFFHNMVTSGLPGLNKETTLSGKTFLSDEAIKNGLAHGKGDLKQVTQIIMLGLEYKALNKFKGQQTLSARDLLEVQSILDKAGINAKILVPESVVYDASDGKKIYVYAEEGEDPVGKRCVYANDAGEPTEENVEAGDHELSDGKIMTVSIKEEDGLSYVDAIKEAEETDESAGDAGAAAKKKPTMSLEKVIELAATKAADMVLEKIEFGSKPPAAINGVRTHQVVKEGAMAKKKKEILENYKKK